MENSSRQGHVAVILIEVVLLPVPGAVPNYITTYIHIK